MEQNINLLTTLNIQTISSFNAKLMIQIIGGWVLLLVLIYTTSLITNTHKQKTLANLESTQKNLQTQIETLNQELALLIPIPVDVLKNIESLPFSSTNTIGFYRYLEDLAKFTPTDIWLDNIVFSQPDNLILLKGNAMAASSIPIFIEALNNSDDFNNKKFGTLQLQKIPTTNNIGFTLGTIATTEVNKTK